MIIQIKQDLIKCLKENNWEFEEFNVLSSKNLTKGHYFSNVILAGAKKLAVPRQELIDAITRYFEKNCSYLDRSILVSNDYCYFTLKPKVLTGIINQILTNKEVFGKTNIGTGIKVNYEWVSANPTGYLHIGHARNIFVGQTITNLLEFSGHTVTREFYINDYGNQMVQLGKTVFYYYQKELGLDPKFEPEMYQNPEVSKAGAMAAETFGNQYQTANYHNEPKVQQLFINFGSDFFLKEMQRLLKLCGIEFDVWFSEKSLYQTPDNLNNIVKTLNDAKVLYKKDNATWFKNTSGKYAADFVLVKSDGGATYFSGDIMYHNHKYERKFDQIIDLWGADHYGHFLKIQAGLAALGWDAKKFEVDLLQMVKVLKGGKLFKISKRQGTTVPIVDVLKVTNLDFLHFMMLSRKRSTKLEIDLDVSEQKNNKNPLFYTQYAHARCSQILKKTHLSPKVIDDYHYLLSDSTNTLLDSTSTELLLTFHEFQTIINRASIDREPQYLVAFAIKVAKLFHHFYENQLILAPNTSIQQERINLVKATQQILRNIFGIIAISAPEKM